MLIYNICFSLSDLLHSVYLALPTDIDLIILETEEK